MSDVPLQPEFARQTKETLDELERDIYDFTGRRLHMAFSDEEVETLRIALRTMAIQQYRLSVSEYHRGNHEQGDYAMKFGDAVGALCAKLDEADRARSVERLRDREV